MPDRTLSIRELTLEHPQEIDNLIDDLNRFLGPYTDPRPEMQEAIEQARDEGFILEARDPQNRRVGVVVITTTAFQRFQPRYHLAYIAAAPEARGQGVGKKLLAEAQQLTGNEIALHVGPSNEGAIAFYKKLGWDIKYIRMMPAKSGRQ